MNLSTLSQLSVATLFTLITLSSSVAFAQGMSVRYSYAKTDFDGQPIYALIPNVDPRFDSRTNKINIQKAFDALKSDKSNTYLNTTALITGSDRSPKVSIKIDPNAAAKGYGLIIMAEAVYTLSELGVPEVEFPGYAARPMSRGDIPFVAFSVNVPLWKALTPGSKRQALNSPNIQVVMPNGEVVPSAEIAKKWASKDKGLEQALYQYLHAPETYTTKEVAKLLKSWNLDYGEKVVQLLKNPSTSVQNTGLLLLADERDNKEVLQAVNAYLQLQKKSNKTQAATAANWLGLAKNPDFSIQKHLYFIDYGTPEEAAAAAQALGSYKDKEALSKLESKLSIKDSSIALAAAQALAQQAQTAIERKALADKKVSPVVKLQIAKNLAATPDKEDQLAGLDFLSKNGSVKERIDAVNAIGKIEGSAARSLLDAMLTTNDEFVLQAALAQLLQRAEIGSLEAVAKAMENKKTAQEAQRIGDAIMEKLDFQGVERKTRDRNPEIQRLAYRVLAKKSKIRSVLDILERALDDKKASIRGAATTSILEFYSKYPDKVVAAIQKSTADTDPSVRHDAAIAIASIPEPHLTDELVRMLKDKDPAVVAAAIDSLAARQQALAWDSIKELSKAADEHVRASAFLAMAQLVPQQDAKGVREVISSLSGAIGDPSKVVKIAAIKGLGRFKDDRAVASIAVNASNDDIAIRIATLEAVAASGHKSAKSILVSGLEDKDAVVRAAAVKGLATLKDKSAAKELASRLEREEDPDIRNLIEETRKSL